MDSRAKMFFASRPLAACAKRQCNKFYHPRNGKTRRSSNCSL